MVSGQSMNLFLKKIFTFFLLAMLLAPLSYTFIFQARQTRVQQKMKIKLQGNMLHTLVMAKEDLLWVKPEKEILVGEKMFDIKTIEYRTDGTVYITGLFDHEESFLYAQLKKSRNEENNRNNQQLVHLFQLLQAAPDNHPQQYSFTVPSSVQRPLYSENRLPSPFQSILTPPPQG